MAKTTAIAWCDSTFNPWRICTPIGPGCDNCYAAALGHRFGLEYKQGVPRIRTSHSNWTQPLAWNRAAEKAGKRHRVFCASLADVFDNEVPKEWRDDLFWLLMQTPNLEWLIVTKRIGNVATMWPAIKTNPLPNVRVLITVCNQEEADRDIPKLLALPCKNGISYEPALGPVDWHMDLTTVAERKRVAAAVAAGSQAEYMAPIGMQLQWVIVGGESGGSKARPFDLAWARSTIEQCKTAGVPCFFKQAGSNPIEQERFHPAHTQGDLSGAELSRRFWQFKDRAGADHAEWPEDLRVQQFPT